MSGLAKPKFPDSIWDGTGPTYPDTNISKHPDSRMGDQYTAEIIALERILIDAIQELKVLKNLGPSHSILGVDGEGINLEWKQSNIVQKINDSVNTLTICTPVYIKLNGNTDRAQANTHSKIKVLGLTHDLSINSLTSGNIQINGIFEATISQWDAITNTTGGLIPGVIYYLSATTAGKLTDIAPITYGQFVVRVGMALSSTRLEIFPSQPIKL